MATTNNIAKPFKVVLVGNGGVGKTTFVKRYLSGQFEQKYYPTIGLEAHPIVLHTNHGTQVLNVWDCAGMEKFGGLRDGYYIGMDAAMVMFDLDSRKSLVDASTWIRDLRRVKPDVPILLVGNKCDIIDRKVTHEEISIMMDLMSIPYTEVSAKSCFNYEKPFLFTLKTLTKHEDIHLIVQPPSPTTDIKKNKKEILKNIRVTLLDALVELEQLEQSE